VRRDPKGRWGSPAGPSTVLVLLAVLLSGCAVGEPDVSATPRRELAARPEASAGTPVAPRPSSTASAAPTAPGPSASEGTDPRPPGAAATTAPTVARPQPVAAPAGEGPYRAVGSLTDLRDDHGREGPSYADVVGVLLEDDGTRLRATVRMGGAVPLRTATAEVLGVGVDLYDRSGEFESDYQLFADGGDDGWFAYLSTPEGFVRYPGRFQITGDQLVFTVPWSAVGGRRDGWTKAFADWARDGGGTLGGNATANDRAPLAGSVGYRIG
jgi:hypothetical protein